MQWRTCVPVLLLFGCEAQPEQITSQRLVPDGPAANANSAAVMDYSRKHIAIADFLVPQSELIDSGENPREAREHVIEQIGRLYPDLQKDTALLASLTGEATWVVVAIPAELERIAPLIARAYQLLDLERRSRLQELRAKQRQQ